MADHHDSRADIAAQAVAVRAELKTWEKDFAATHEGKKASQEDIKERPDIAAKYKEYRRLKNLEAAVARRENRQQQERSESKKRKHASPPGPPHHDINTTPRKSAKGLFATPSNNRTVNAHPFHLDPYDSPTTFRRLFSPSTHRQSMPPPSPLKAAIGPTPQRDGKALGLFDMISESGGSGSNATPSAKRQKDALGAGFQTPSKPKLFAPILEAPEDEEEPNSRLSRTPASSSKQFYLANLFATPTTMRYAAMVEKEDDDAAKENTRLDPEAPVSRHSNPSETPSFLRRSNIGRFPLPSTNDGAGLSPIASRKPPQYAGRGLSHLVQGLRAMEEERLEDEWDMLREIEAEQEMMDFEDPENQPVEENHKPYKKKGQKRTTRRVIMRPVIPKPKSKTQDPIPEESESEDELAAVPETQIQEVPQDIEEAAEKDDDVASLHSISGGSEFEDTDFDSDEDPEFSGKAKAPSRPKSFSERIKEAVSKAEPAVKNTAAKPSPQKVEPEKEEKKPKERKLNPQAHANYRTLKIGNRGGRGRGRFRRR